MNCSYCGASPSNSRKDGCSDFVLKYNGLDRIDSSIPYKKNNVTPCCWECNQIKLDLSLDRFLDRCCKIYKNNDRERKLKYAQSAKVKLNEKQLSAFKSLYKEKILKRSKELELTDNLLPFEEYVKLASAECYYCGAPPDKVKKYFDERVDYNGIDRKNNDIGYTIENSVPCCSECNYSKMEMTDSFFLEKNKSIFVRLNLDNVLPLWEINQALLEH